MGCGGLTEISISPAAGRGFAEADGAAAAVVVVVVDAGVPEVPIVSYTFALAVSNVKFVPSALYVTLYAVIVLDSSATRK